MDTKIVIDQQNNELIRRFGKEKIQAFQDSFPVLFNISLCLLSLEGKALTVWSNPSLFCHYMLNNNRERCIQERQKAANYIFNRNQTGIFTCYMGLTFFCVPVFMEKKPVAYFYGGPIYLEENMKLAKKKLNIDVPILSERKVQDIIQFLENLCKLLSINEDAVKIEHQSNTMEFPFLQKKLSLREIEVVKLINNGLSNKEIACNLHISERTVKTHVSNILRKMEMENRMQIVFFCQQNNIV